MTQQPRLIFVNAKTVFTASQLEIAWDLWSSGFDTMVIARRLNLPEFAIWNNMDLIRGVSEERAA